MATQKQHQQSPFEESKEKGTDKRLTGGLLSQIGEHDQQSPTILEREIKETVTHRLIVDVAEKLFRQLGFQKTTVADIARQLGMSPANVYRFFAAKSEINAAVCRAILGKIEAEAEKIALRRGSAAQRLQNLLAFVERSHYKRYTSDRKLHELVEIAISEKWPVIYKHKQHMAAIVEQIIASGMQAGEFRPGDTTIEATLDQMIDFYLAPLTQDTTRGQRESLTTYAENTSQLKQLEIASFGGTALPRLAHGCGDGAALLWDHAVESLGRSAHVLEELAESTGEAIGRIAARGDRIDRIQSEIRALLNALAAPEANA